MRVMKLSKYSSITITSASLVIYGFGVVQQVGAQDLVTTDLTTQIQQVLETPADSDELLVDQLSEVESDLKQAGVSEFALNSTDSAEIKALKEERLRLVQELRSKLNSLDGAEKQAFLAKIRARRSEVRTKLYELRREARLQANQSLEEAREKFKVNLENRLKAAQERRLDARDKFKLRLEENTQKRQEKVEQYKDKINTGTGRVSDEIKALRKENLERQKVQGIVDYQPETLLEKIGYFLQSL